MSFLYPTFLFGLFALAIPIIIHLFNFKRYKKVAFSNVRFLQEIKERTQAQSQLKHLLILLMRLLAITFLVFSFAQPFIKDESVKAIKGNSTISIFLDNSFSMNGVGTEGNLLETGRQFSYKIAEAYGQADEFQVLDHAFLPQHQRLYSKESIINTIDEVQLTPSSKSFSEVLKRQKEIFEKTENKNHNIYQIIDGQAEYFDGLNEFKVDSTSINFMVLPPEINSNILIDSCWFESPVRSLGQPEELKVRLKNLGDETRTGIPVKLFINENQKSLVNADIPANGNITIAMGYTVNSTGNIFGKVALSDYPITFDDEFFFNYTIQPNINIVTISPNDTSRIFHSLFRTDPYFKLNQFSEGNIDYSKIKNSNLLIINGLSSISSALVLAIDDLLQKGMNVCYIPSQSNNKIDVAFSNSLHLPALDKVVTQKSKVAKLNYAHPLYDNVFEKQEENIDLPTVSKYFPINNSQIGYETIMALDNGSPFLLSIQYESGKVFCFASPLTDSTTNFSKHALFVPTFFQMALKTGAPKNLFYELGQNQSIDLAENSISNEDVIHIKGVNQNIDIIPELQRGRQKFSFKIYDQIDKAGAYEIFVGEKKIGGLALNYSRKESETKYLTAEEITTLLKEKGFQNIKVIEESLSEVSKSLSQEATGTQLWQFCLLLSIVFFGLEMLLLRLFK